MKKFGFTLAEVLITLGIIGVVAALTLPSLYTDTQGAQVGPKLGKAVAMFEQANQALLSENGVDSLSELGFNNNIESYRNAIANYLKISSINSTYTVERDSTIGPVNFDNNNNTWLSKDGTLYLVLYLNNQNLAGAPHRVRLGTVLVDVNGISGPNLPGTDVFAFLFQNDGSLTPVGTTQLDDAEGSDTPDADYAGTWQTDCPNDATPHVGRYYTCTASIFENNMKVMYKMR